MTEIGQQPDEYLLRQLSTGDRAAFGELYNRHWEWLYAAAFRRLKEKEAAEEVVQDFFTSIWLNRGKLKYLLFELSQMAVLL